MELKVLLKNLAKALNRRKIDYMVTGGQAVLIYGEPRLTRDIDITLGMGIDGLTIIMEIVEELKLKILVNNPQKFVERIMVLPLIHEKSERGIKEGE